MFFQVNVTPEARQKKKPVVKPPNESEEISVLSLAPFTANPKIFFEDIPVGKEARRLLNVKNPTKCPIKIFLTKVPPPERQVTFNWGEKLIEPASEEMFEIFWMSTKGGPWRDNITFEDGFKIKRDVPITFKSLPPKVTRKPVKKAPVTSKTVHKVQKTVPLKKSPKKVLRPKFINPSIVIESPTRRQTYNVDDKENFNLPLSSTFQENVFSPASSTFNFDKANDTYSKRNHRRSGSCTFEDSLEVNSPAKVEEPSPIRRLQSLAFTPLVNNTLTSRLKDINFTPENRFHFNPSICSSEEKSYSTFHLGSAEKVHDLSSETYVKGNLSGETYVKGNLSGETYVKNTSACTYIKDDSVGDLAALSSPVELKRPEVFSAKSIIEANMWATEPNKKPKQLDIIAEESSFFSDSQTPGKSFNIRKRKSNYLNMVSPPKRLQREENKDWGRKSITAKKSKVTKGLNLMQFITKAKVNLVESDLVVLHNPEAYLSNNPYFYAESSEGFDPFMSATLYYEPKWMDEQEVRFKRWLNALLTPPEELTANSEGPKDISKIWQECNRKDIEKPLSKEEISNKVHVKSHLEVLRRNAVALFQSREMTQVLSKCVKMVECKKFEIRADRDVHLNLSLQSEVMSLFLAYNPLWLRIGLEVVFGFKLKLTSNSDVVGLSRFLVQYYFNEPYLLKKYKSVHAANYSAEINKHMLKKFLMLVYFLDCGKNTKLIPHDPCLFCKNASIKESREILIKFSSLLLHAIGDITKSLRLIGYVVSYKQLFIHEFEYAIENLGVDLRDGVRLVRVMEIILLRSDLTRGLRVPAISRIQKVHNMKIAFKALVDAEYEILHEIDPKDVVDGHREKTLSFLWQIIHKFEGPRMKKAVITVQHWWNCLRMVIKRRILRKHFERRNSAARTIQVWYKRQTCRSRLEFFVPLLRQYLKTMREHRAAVKIQTQFRMYSARKRYVELRRSIIAIQSFTRKWLVQFKVQVKVTAIVTLQSATRAYLARKKFVALKATVRYVELRYIALKDMQAQRSRFLELKHYVIFIQRKFKAMQLTKIARAKYTATRESVITIQRAFRAHRDKSNYARLRQATVYLQLKFRSLKRMQLRRAQYLETRNATLVIQRWIRASQERKRFLRLKRAVVLIQRKHRASTMMKAQKEKYSMIRESAITIQRRFKSFKERKHYLKLKQSAVNIQRRFRALKLMQMQREDYLRIKDFVTKVQRIFRANNERKNYLLLRRSAIKIQQRFRARKLMRIQKESYLRLRDASIAIQRKFKANSERRCYVQLRIAAVNVQRRFRALKLMRVERKNYAKTRESAIKIQRVYRAHKERESYLTLRRCAVNVQRRFRALKSMRIERDNYLRKKLAAIKLQAAFRAFKERKSYSKLKRYAAAIQQRFRAQKSMRLQRSDYLKLKELTIKVQSAFKARRGRGEFLKLRRSAIVIQQRYRASKLMEAHRNGYSKQRDAAIKMQRAFRTCMERKRYLALRNAAVVFQRRYRALRAMQCQRKMYLQLRESAVKIQRQFRTIRERRSYLQLRESVVVVQRRFRAVKMMRIEMRRYARRRELIVKMQRAFRTRVEREGYLELRRVSVAIQRRYRALKLMQSQRSVYLKMRDSAIEVQRSFRAKKERQRYLNLKRAALVVQRRFRALKLMVKKRESYLRMRESCVKIQSSYKAYKAKERYRLLRRCAVNVQLRFRALREMRRQRLDYVRVKESCVRIQRGFRGYKQRKSFLEFRRAVVLIQARFKALRMMRIRREEFLRMRDSAVKIQRAFRARVERKRRMLQDRNCEAMVTKLQARCRGFLVRASARIKLKRKEASAIRIQALWRGFKARKVVGPELEKLRERKNASVKIQAAWRGYKVRKAMSVDLQEIRTRVKEVQAAPERTLGQRRIMALKILIDSYSSLLQMIRALQDLDFITRRSKESCLSMSMDVPENLFSMVISTARSLPDMQACKLASSILINFCKYDKSKRNCWYPQYLEEFVKVMLHWCDKEGDLFPHFCTLFWLYTQDPEWLKYIKALPNLEQSFAKMKTLSERKAKMVAKSYNSKQASAFSGYSKLPLPSLKPDWGYECKDKPRVFHNSLHALKSVLDNLGLNSF